MLIHWKSHSIFKFRTFQVSVSSRYHRCEEALDMRTLKFRNTPEQINIYLLSTTPKPIIMPTDISCDIPWVIPDFLLSMTVRMTQYAYIQTI